MDEPHDPVKEISRLFDKYKRFSNQEIIDAIITLPVLPNEDDPIWDTEQVWLDLEYPFEALARIAAERQLRAAIPLLLERASYGDPYEMMRNLRHSLEAIVNPDWGYLADICIQTATLSQRGARLWSVRQLGILRNPRAEQPLIKALRDEADLVRYESCRSLEMLCQTNPESRPIAIKALSQYIENYPGQEDQKTGQESIKNITTMFTF